MIASKAPTKPPKLNWLTRLRRLRPAPARCKGGAMAAMISSGGSSETATCSGGISSRLSRVPSTSWPSSSRPMKIRPSHQAGGRRRAGLGRRRQERAAAQANGAPKPAPTATSEASIVRPISEEAPSASMLAKPSAAANRLNKAAARP
ncbi:MAG: hypothetical protein V9H69_23000 [Anaerolineae bacterium]